MKFEFFTNDSSATDNDPNWRTAKYGAAACAGLLCVAVVGATIADHFVDHAPQPPAGKQTAGSLGAGGQSEMTQQELVAGRVTLQMPELSIGAYGIG